MAGLNWYADNNITLHLGDPVQSIDRAEKTIHSATTASVILTITLILATGSSAFVPPIPGVEKEGVFIYRTIEDLEMMTTHGHAKQKQVL